MRIENTLRRARRARCIEERTGAALGKAAPAGIGRGAAEIEKLVEAERVEAVRRNLGARREDDEGLARCEIGGKGLGKVAAARVEQQEPVPGVVCETGPAVVRADERRVGEECGMTCRAEGTTR